MKPGDKLYRVIVIDDSEAKLRTWMLEYSRVKQVRRDGSFTLYGLAGHGSIMKASLLNTRYHFTPAVAFKAFKEAQGDRIKEAYDTINEATRAISWANDVVSVTAKERR